MSLIPSPRRERQVFQMATAILALIPIGAGLVGVLAGFGVFGDGAAVARDLDSHGRYLSGLLLGIGLGFWSTVSRPEACGPRVRLLATIVVIGGLARLFAATRAGLPSTGMTAALVMELVVTPALALWRERIERIGAPFG